MKNLILILGLLFPILINSSCERSVNTASRKIEITKTIHDGIGWALNKDLDLLYSIMAQDSNFLVINPDSSKIEGFSAFKKVAETFWMDPRFKATQFEVKNLKITISESGTVAWYSCLLDDFGEWDGKAIGWNNVRWTGILEERKGKWVHTQMHFSFPTSD